MKLARDKVTHANGNLLVEHVSRQVNHFHAVQKRAGNHRLAVGGGDKHHLLAFAGSEGQYVLVGAPLIPSVGQPWRGRWGC